MWDKDTTITIRLSSRERQTIRERAYAYGMSVSQYIRFLAINTQIDKVVVKEKDHDRD